MSRIRRPLLYPAGLLAAFVLAFVEGSGVSPWAGVRPLAVAVAVGLTATVVASAATNSRDRGALIATVLCLLLAVGGRDLVGPMLLALLVLLVVEAVVARRRPVAIRWPMITRTMSTVTAVLLLAIAIRGVQDGRAASMAQELLAEAPGHAPWVVAPTAANAQTPGLPDVYLLLLDGYPRSDKLAERFGIDNSGFEAALRDRGFEISSLSRSNYPSTRMTLASMLNGAHLGDLFTGPPQTPDWRRAIDQARWVDAFRREGYRIVSISSGYEDAVLRRADRYVDTGQVTEFEYVLLCLTPWRALAPEHLAAFLVRDGGDRVRQSFDAAMELSDEGGAPRFAFIHIGSPHAPLALDSTGAPVEATRPGVVFGDRQEREWLGSDYDRILQGQIEYLNRRTIALVDTIRSSEREAIIVVFSDHGSGVDFSEDSVWSSDLDLRTANFLAVATPGEERFTDDRSTLVNLVGRIATFVFDAPVTEVPEETRIYDGNYDTYEVFRRRD